MKNDSVNGKLLQRGNVSRPKKDNLLAEGKLVKDVPKQEKIEASNEIKNTGIDYENTDSQTINKDKILQKPKSINRLFNSVKRLNGTEPSLVCTNLPQMSSIPEVSEDTETITEVLQLEIHKEDNKKQLPVKPSQKILGMAKNWDNRNSKIEENEIVIDEKEFEERTSIIHNPKLLKRLYNTKKRLCGNEI
jgi:hypothetical protein